MKIMKFKINYLEYNERKKMVYIIIGLIILNIIINVGIKKYHSSKQEKKEVKITKSIEKLLDQGKDVALDIKDTYEILK